MAYEKAGTAIPLALFMAMGCASSASAQSVRAVPVGNFSSPVYVTVAPGQPRLLFVVERQGRIQVLRDEVKLSKPFLNISNIVRGPPDGNAGGEQGLLSVAFPPNYQTSRRFYVAFTNSTGDVEVSEFRRRAGSAAEADPGSRRVLLTIPHREAGNHNGGQLQFGPDGMLYISVGDGGAAPKGDLARRLNSLLGKVLRIDPLPAGGKPYGIPNDNPFVGKTGRDEIFAYGFRNPWRFSFDNNRIAIGDVGEVRQEEINVLKIEDASGVNFGWPQFEGNLVFDSTRPGPGPAKPPMFVYGHNGSNCAVIGGYVVRDPDLPALQGRYLYGDACSGDIRSFIPKVGTQTAKDDKSTGLTLSGLSGFGRGFDNQIYVVQLGGGVSRLEPQP